MIKAPDGFNYRFTAAAPVTITDYVLPHRTDSAKHQRIADKLDTMIAKIAELHQRFLEIEEQERKDAFGTWWREECDPSTMKPEKLRRSRLDAFAKRIAKSASFRQRLLEDA